MNIKDLQKEAYAIAKEKGWHDTPRSVGDLIALCHSELSEALEAYRIDENPQLIWLKAGKPEGFPIELADLIIRVADMTSPCPQARRCGITGSTQSGFARGAYWRPLQVLIRGL